MNAIPNQHEKPLRLLMLAQSLYRILLTLFLAAIISCTLFILMSFLIKTDNVPYNTKEPIKIPPIIMEKFDPVIFEEEQLTKPEPPETPPERMFETTDIDPITTQLPITVSNYKHETTNIIIKRNRSEPLPIFRVAAVYPSRPLARGIEGYVDLIFDVNEIGATKNIQVLFSEPSSIFDKAAKKAVSKWRYEPKLIDGQGAYQEDVKTRVRFTIKKS